MKVYFVVLFLGIAVNAAENRCILHEWSMLRWSTVYQYNIGWESGGEDNQRRGSCKYEDAVNYIFVTMPGMH